eukprot:jgi/Picsp_1/1989/NSC_05455-R1_probable protein phosphatase
MRLHQVAKKTTCRGPCQSKRLGLLPTRHRTVTVFSPSSSSNGSNNDTGSDSMEILGSFFVGKAFAEVLNERLGNAAADALAEFGKMEAEIRKEISDFQQEVMARSRRDMAEATGASEDALLTPGSDKASSAMRKIDIEEAADDLRAEIASTRSLIQQLRTQKSR